MDLIIDSAASIKGNNLVRCSKCLAFLELGNLKDCPDCGNPICNKCGHCKCNNKGREIQYALQKDSWIGEHLA